MEMDIIIHGATPDDVARMMSGLGIKVVTVASRPGISKNFSAPEWNEEERSTILAAVDGTDAWEKYHAAFPESTRSLAAVKRMRAHLLEEAAAKKQPDPAPAETPKVEDPPVKKQLKELREKKKAPENKTGSRADNAHAPIWSDEQIAAIRDCKTKEEAWEAFSKAYPGQRNANAVHQRWHKVAKNGKDAVTKGSSRKNSGKDIPCPFCGTVCNSHGMHKHVKFTHPEKFEEWQKDPDRLQKGIHKEPAPAAAEESESQLNCDKIVTGIKVRQVKPVDGKLLFGTGTVVTRDGDLVTVKNGGSKKHVLDVRCLEIVTKPVKQPKKQRLPLRMKNREPAAPVQENVITRNFDDDEPIINIVGSEGLILDDEDPLDRDCPILITYELPQAIASSNDVKEPPEPDERHVEEMDDPAPEKSGPHTIGLNDLVKQTGGSRRMAGTGKVIRAPQGNPEVLAKFDNGMEWILRSNLELVRAPA